MANLVGKNALVTEFRSRSSRYRRGWPHAGQLFGRRCGNDNGEVEYDVLDRIRRGDHRAPLRGRSEPEPLDGDGAASGYAGRDVHCLDVTSTTLVHTATEATIRSVFVTELSLNHALIAPANPLATNWAMTS